MSSITKMPTPPASGIGTLISSCAAVAVSVVLAGGMVLIMR